MTTTSWPFGANNLDNPVQRPSFIGANDVTAEPTPAITSNYRYIPYDPNRPQENITLDGSTYKIGSFSYPEDIMSEQYGGNYAMFFINVQSESKLTELSGSAGFAINSLTGLATATGLNQVTGQNIGLGAVTAIQTAIGTGQGAIVGGVASSIFGSATSGPQSGLIGKIKSYSTTAKTILSGVAGGIVRGGATVAVASELGTFNQPVKRLKTAIALHMPVALSVRYAVNYEEAEIGLEYRGAQALGNNTTGTVAAGATAYAMSNAGDASGMISKLTKTAVNPVKEQVFKSVEFRTFTFNYTFAPRSSTESQNCLNIIQQFKFHMHPEFKDQDQFLYIYPSEFDISYYNNNKQNDKIHHHTSCVLTDLALNYAPQGTYSTFADGTPTQIEMTLTFRELGKLDKANIQKEKF